MTVISVNDAPQGTDELAQHREADPHDVVVVALDAAHERAADPVDGEVEPDPGLQEALADDRGHVLGVLVVALGVGVGAAGDQGVEPLVRRP